MISVFGSELLRTGGDVYQLNPDNTRVKEKVGNDREFTKHFFLFCGQKNVHALRNYICAEIESLLVPLNKYETYSVCEELRKSVKEWKVDKRSNDPESLTSNWTKWTDIVQKHVTSKVTDSNRLTTSLKFHNVEIVREHIERANPAYVRPLSADTMALSVTKVHQAIHPETHIIVTVERFMESPQRVLGCWGPFCRWLVLVEDNAEESGQWSEMLNEMRGQIEDGRHLIIVSMRDEKSFQDSFWCGDVSDESWDDLLLTKIRLNGNKRKCKLRDLVSSRAELQIMLKHNLPCLVALARHSGYVKLGQTLDPLPANYVPRQLVTRQYVRDEFFSSLAVRDVCVMDNRTYQILIGKMSYILKHYKECSFEELEGYLALHTSVPVLVKTEWIDTIALEGICSKFKGLHVYIVKHTERGWNVQSFSAGSGRIRRYVKEQNIQLLEALDAFNNKVIVEGAPGVGKSTVLLDLAGEVKQNNPSSWVVWINLRECYEKFEKHTSVEEVNELILRSVVPKEVDQARLELMLLVHCLQKHKHMVCLVDGFDVVCPHYTNEFIEALRMLSPRQGKLVVTTRPAAARLLEDNLGSLAHLLPVFSDSQLQKCFNGFRRGVPRMRIETLPNPLKDLLKIPLFAKMYKDLVGAGTVSYDTLTLCEAFFHNKFRKLYKEQFGVDLFDPAQRNDEELKWKSHEAKLKRIASLLLVQNGDNIWQSKRPYVDQIFVKAGIVHQVTGEMPLFKHRAFGEYFLAKWCFSDAGQKARAAVYSSAHTGRSLEFFLEVFDRMASRGRQLLSAVLDGDEKTARALLQAGVGPAERDAWGRSALHLAAARGAGAQLLRLLCGHLGAALAEQDALLHWTPLQYAARRGHWGAVEALLQAGAHLSQLGSIQEAISIVLSKHSLRVNALVQNLLVRIAEEYGHSKVLNMLWKLYCNAENINVDSDDDKAKSELHIAILKGDKAKVRKLISTGADLEVRDENGETALHYAVKAKSPDIVKLLIEAGAHLDAHNKDRQTALHFAARLDSGSCALLLVSAGAEMDARDRLGATPVHYAVAKDATDVFKVLTESGADLKARDDDGMSALHYAALEGSVKCTRLLLRKGASVHLRDRLGATPLHYAGGGKVADIVKILVEAGARVHQCDEDGMTALHYAANRGSAECACVLVNSGAGVNVQDNFGATPLHYAVKTNDTCATKLLIEAGAHMQVRDTHGKTALHYAKHQKCASLLIGAGADVNLRDKAGATPLHYAAEEDATDFFKLLMESGARPQSRNGSGLTALHYAARRGSVKAARLLISDIISVNVPDKDGATPLHYAARAPNADCASLLVRAGADIRMQDNGGLTALHYAARACNPECVSFLVSAGTNVNLQDKKGATTLHYAAMLVHTIPCRMDKLVEGAAECIRQLLASGAHPDTQDEQRKTALHYAVSAGNVPCVGLLIDAGSDVLATDKNGETALHYAVKADSSMCFMLLLRSVATNPTS